MKAALFRKDNIGVVVGRLKNENMIQYENNGHISTFSLTGNVVDTEYNDVFILGIKIDENTLDVQKMESLPHNNDSIFGFRGVGTEGNLFCLAVPKNNILNITEKVSSNNRPYHVVHIEENKNNTIYLNVYGPFKEDIQNESYVFILTQAFEQKEHIFGEGYAKKKKIVKSSGAYQIIS